MTEGSNSPRGAGDPLATPAGAQPPVAPPAPATPQTGSEGTQAGSDSKKDAAKGAANQAKDTAKDAAGTAKDTAGQAKDTAKDTAKETAKETVEQVQYRAQDLVAQGRDELSSQATQQQQRLAGSLRSVSSELRSMADCSEEKGVASDLARQASSYVDQAGQWLESREPTDLLNEVTSYARRRPGMFMAVAAGAGLLAGRVTRSLKDERSDDGSGDRSAGTAPAHRATPATPAAPATPPPGTTQYQPAHGTPATGAATGPATGPAGPAATGPGTSGYDTNLPGGGGAR